MSEQMEHSGTIFHNTATPITIKVTKGMKNTYSWEIEAKGWNSPAMLAEIANIDSELAKTYKSEGGKESDSENKSK